MSKFKTGSSLKTEEPRFRRSEDEPAHRWLKRTLLIGTCVAVVIIGLGVLFIFSYTSNARGVNVEIGDIGNVSRGVPFNLEVSASNNSGATISGAVITVNLPAGMIAPGPSGDRTLITDSVGDISSGNLVKRTYSVVPIGDVGSNQTVKTSLSYEIETGARFESNGSGNAVISDSAVEIDVKKPDQILSGSEFSIEIDYTNKSSSDIPGLNLQAEYPDYFKFDSASVPPSSLNNYWDLGSLKAGADGKLSISGTLSLASGGASIPLTLSANFGDRSYPIAEGSADLSSSASPISLDVFVNNQSDYVANLGDVLNYSIRYENQSGIALSDVRINASISGSMADMSTLSTNGSWNASSQTISWDSSNLPSLKMLDPGASGEVDFKVNLKSAFPIKTLSDRNFLVRAAVTVSSPSVPYYLSASQTSVQETSDVKVSGLALLTARGFWNDPETGIADSGTLPPKVGQPTQYTIHWLIKNFSTDLNSVEVSAPLAPGVKWTGTASANLGSAPVYQASENSVVWDIDRVAATKGVLSDPAEAIFQVEATPDASMVGKAEPLIGPTSMKAIDAFTDLNSSENAPSIDTSALGDIVDKIVGFVIQ